MTTFAQTYPQLARQLTESGWASDELASVRAAWDLAASLFAGAERGSGKPFIDHLVGTASGVLVGGGSAAAVAAALLHAAYDQGDFGDGRTGPTASHRARLSAAVGAEAEDLVLRYHELGWGPSVAAEAAQTAANASPSARSVLLMRVANEVDDVLDGALLLAGKASRPSHTGAVHEIVVEIAVEVGTPALAAIARRELLGDAPVILPELVIGSVVSTVRLPASSCRRPSVLAVRWTARARRLLGRSRRRVRGGRTRNA